MLINGVVMDNFNWIRSMRIKQGLKGFQLAERLQVSAARVSVLEKDEKRGAVTLKMMDKAAKAMGCRFEYRIVPIAPAATVRDEGALKNTSSPQLSAEKPRIRVVAK